MKTKSTIFATTIFAGACGGALLYFATPGGFVKISERADSSLAEVAALPDPSGKPNTTTIFKTNYSMPSSISETLATLWIERARKERFEGADQEIADIVENQVIEPCELPGRIRMEDGNCWRPEAWKKLHP